jgi:hypothetical protein
VVAEVVEGEEVPMMEIPTVLVPREMLRPEIGVSVRGAGVRLAEVLAGAAAEVQVAVLRPRGEEEAPEEEVVVVEVPHGVGAQAIPATPLAAEAEAETADAEAQRGPLIDIEKSSNGRKAINTWLRYSTV